MKDRANSAFENAKDKLRQANEEICRPEEDIVTYVVCNKSQSAINNYLKGLLLKEGVDPTDYTTIESLYNQCLVLNDTLRTINLKDFKCGLNHIDANSCNEVSKISSCFEKAESLDTLLRNERILV